MIKIRSVLGILAISLLLLGSIALSSGMTKEELEYRPFTIKDVTQAFAEKGLKLESAPGEVGFADTVLFGIEPEIYRIQDTEDLVFIYPFASQEERKQVAGFSSRFDCVLMDYFQPYSFFFQPHIAKNMFIVYCPYIENVNDLIPEKYLNSSIPSRSKAIKELIFTDLNKGKTLIFRGEGQYWEAQTTYQYTNQFYRDDQGVLGHEGWNERRTVVRYIGNDPSQVGMFEYSLLKPHGSGGGSGLTLNQEGLASLGGSGGNGALSSAKDVYTLTITWRGMSETFDLKVHPSGFALLPIQK